MVFDIFYNIGGGVEAILSAVKSFAKGIVNMIVTDPFGIIMMGALAAVAAAAISSMFEPNNNTPVPGNVIAAARENSTCMNVELPNAVARFKAQDENFVLLYKNFRSIQKSCKNRDTMASQEQALK